MQPRCHLNQAQNDTCKDGVQKKFVQIEEIMDEWWQWRLATSFANYVSIALLVCLGPQNMKFVLQIFLSTLKIHLNLPYYIIPTNIAFA
jgi:hypothetical protein